MTADGPPPLPRLGSPYYCMTPPYHFYLIRMARRVEGLRSLECYAMLLSVRSGSRLVGGAAGGAFKRSASVPLTALTNPVCAAMRSLVLTGLFVLFKVFI